MPEEQSFRLEKTVGNQTLYVSFKVEARNCVIRGWNIFVNDRPESKTDRENFQSAEDVKTYLTNAKAQYLKQGYKDPAAKKSSKKEETAAAATDLE
jgi:predicted DNA-binding WGR domain protein